MTTHGTQVKNACCAQF